MNCNAGAMLLLIAFISIGMLLFGVTPRTTQPPRTEETAPQAATTQDAKHAVSVFPAPFFFKPTVSLSPVPPVIVRFPIQRSATHATAISCLENIAGRVPSALIAYMTLGLLISSAFT